MNLQGSNLFNKWGGHPSILYFWAVLRSAAGGLNGNPHYINPKNPKGEGDGCELPRLVSVKRFWIGGSCTPVTEAVPNLEMSDTFVSLTEGKGNWGHVDSTPIALNQR